MSIRINEARRAIDERLHSQRTGLPVLHRFPSCMGGWEAQVDWYEAWAVLSGERVKLQVFEMRSMASGVAYRRRRARRILPRNHWVQLPQARDLDDLNAYLERCCRSWRHPPRVKSGADRLKILLILPNIFEQTVKIAA